MNPALVASPDDGSRIDLPQSGGSGERAGVRRHVPDRPLPGRPIRRECGSNVTDAGFTSLGAPLLSARRREPGGFRGRTTDRGRSIWPASSGRTRPPRATARPHRSARLEIPPRSARPRRATARPHCPPRSRAPPHHPCHRPAAPFRPSRHPSPNHPDGSESAPVHAAFRLRPPSSREDTPTVHPIGQAWGIGPSRSGTSIALICRHTVMRPLARSGRCDVCVGRSL